VPAALPNAGTFWISAVRYRLFRGHGSSPALPEAAIQRSAADSTTVGTSKRRERPFCLPQRHLDPFAVLHRAFSLQVRGGMVSLVTVPAAAIGLGWLARSKLSRRFCARVFQALIEICDLLRVDNVLVSRRLMLGRMLDTHALHVLEQSRDDAAMRRCAVPAPDPDLV